jgi:hypothetical protein
LLSRICRRILGHPPKFASHLVKEVPEGCSNGTVGKVTTSSNAGKAANDRVRDKVALEVQVFEDWAGEGANGTRQCARPALGPAHHGRDASDQSVAGHVGDVGG